MILEIFFNVNDSMTLNIEVLQMQPKHMKHPFQCQHLYDSTTPSGTACSSAPTSAAGMGIGVRQPQALQERGGHHCPELRLTGPESLNIQEGVQLSEQVGHYFWSLFLPQELPVHFLFINE